MYCIECGAQIQDNSKFCSHCGHKQNIGEHSFKENTDEFIFKQKNTREVFKVYKSPLDFHFFKIAMMWYLAWVVLHLGILLIFSEEIFTHPSYTDDFWPFDDGSANDKGIGEYDIREFLFYTISAFAILIIWSMARAKSSLHSNTNNPK